MQIRLTLAILAAFCLCAPLRAQAPLTAKLDPKRLLWGQPRTEPEKLVHYTLLLIIRNVVQHHDRLAHALGLFGTELFEDRVGGRPVETGH